VEEAACEVEYVNGPSDTPMGQLRARNGHPQPFGCKWWGIGNEMYGGWQLGHIPLSEYVKRHNAFADAVRAVDPSIRIVAVGACGDWTKAMFENCADKMDLLSEHIYCGENDDLRVHTGLLRADIRRVAVAHRELRKTLPALQGRDIRIAMDEWNYWYGPNVFGELGTRYFLKDGLGIAAGLHEFFRNSDLYFMANYAQTVNVIGCVKTSRTAAAMETTGLVLEMYRKYFGVTPVEVSGVTEPLDVVAAWTADRKALTVAVVNPSATPQKIRLDVKGARLSGKGRAWMIAGDDPNLHNDPGEPPRVEIVEKRISDVSAGLDIAPISATVFSLAVTE
jgi:alpha-L-arabinofuranosidase